MIEVLPPPPKLNGNEVKPPFYKVYPALSRALGLLHIQYRGSLVAPCSERESPATSNALPPEASLCE